MAPRACVSYGNGLLESPPLEHVQDVLSACSQVCPGDRSYLITLHRTLVSVLYGAFLPLEGFKELNCFVSRLIWQGSEDSLAEAFNLPKPGHREDLTFAL